MNEKKQYTAEDNIRSMAFCLKDISKKLDDIVAHIQAKQQDYYAPQKKVEDNNLPF